MNQDTIAKMKEASKMWHKPQRTEEDLARIREIANVVRSRHTTDEIDAHLVAAGLPL